MAIATAAAAAAGSSVAVVITAEAGPSADSGCGCNFVSCLQLQAVVMRQLRSDGTEARGCGKSTYLLLIGSILFAATIDPNEHLDVPWLYSLSAGAAGMGWSVVGEGAMRPPRRRWHGDGSDEKRTKKGAENPRYVPERSKVFARLRPNLGMAAGELNSSLLTHI